MTVKTRTNERPTPPVAGQLSNPSVGEPDLDLRGPTARTIARRASWKYLVPLGSPGPSDPILCVHGYDGLASRYRPLSASVDGCRIVGLRAAGADGLQPMHRTLDEMAIAYIEELRAYRPEHPFVILGHAEGGSLAWELARRLVAMGEEVGALLLVDAINPSTGVLDRRVREHLGAFSRKPVSHVVDQATAGIRERRRRRDLNSPEAFSAEPVDAGVKSPVPLDIRKHRLETNTRALLHEYSPEPFAGRVIYFESAPPAGARFHRSAVEDWRAVAPNLEVVPLQSDAGAALTDPHAARLGRLLSSWLPASR